MFQRLFKSEYWAFILIQSWLEAINEQGSHGKGICYSYHACPAVMLAKQTWSERTSRTAQEVDGHINGIDSVDGGGVEGDHTGLIWQMDTLPSSTNHKDGDYQPQVAVISKKSQQPYSQDDTSPGNGEEPYAVLVDMAANEY